MAAAVPEHTEAIEKKLADEGLSHSLIVALARKLRERARLCQAVFE